MTDLERAVEMAAGAGVEWRIQANRFEPFDLELILQPAMGPGGAFSVRFDYASVLVFDPDGALIDAGGEP